MPDLFWMRLMRTVRLRHGIANWQQLSGCDDVDGRKTYFSREMRLLYGVLLHAEATLSAIFKQQNLMTVGASL
jgi:hypothetical protein